MRIILGFLVLMAVSAACFALIPMPFLGIGLPFLGIGVFAGYKLGLLDRWLLQKYRGAGLGVALCVAPILLGLSALGKTSGDESDDAFQFTLFVLPMCLTGVSAILGYPVGFFRSRKVEMSPIAKFSSGDRV